MQEQYQSVPKHRIFSEKLKRDVVLWRRPNRGCWRMQQYRDVASIC